MKEILLIIIKFMERFDTQEILNIFHEAKKETEKEISK